MLDGNGKQKVGARNRKQWKRVLTDATEWNSPKNCELWRSEWAKECNLHLPAEKRIDHRSYERQGKAMIPTIHEGADARKIEAKYHEGRTAAPSWKVEENQIIKKQNAILSKLQEAFGYLADKLSQWKGWLNDIRRKQGSHTHAGRNDLTDRGTAGTYGRDVSGDAGTGRAAPSVSGTESALAGIKQRVAGAASNLARYRRNAVPYGIPEQQNKGTGNRESAMDRISGEVEQREHFIAETESGIAEAKQQLEKARMIDERISKTKQDEQIEELLELLEDAQAELDRKDQTITQLQKQLDDSLALAERLNSENRAENVQALKSDLRHKNESLQSVNGKLEEAESMIGEYQDKLRKAEQARQYAETHQRTVEIPVEKQVLYEKCGKCNRSAYQRERERYERRRNKLDVQYKAKTAQFEMTLFISFWYALMTTAFAAVRSEAFTSDFKAFWSAIWAGIQRTSELLFTAGKSAAQAGDKLPNETAALLAHWLLFLAVTVAITAGTGGLLFLAARRIWKLYQENCMDVISIIVSVISIALIVYFGTEIKALLRLNLIGILLLVQALYVAVRNYVRGCKRARGYY